jgi:hypothetical protein
MTSEQQKLTENLEKEAIRIEKAEHLREEVQAKEEEGYDGFSDSKVKLIPNPNFTECKSVGTMLPINMANETVTNLSILAQEVDLVDFIKDKLKYNSRTKVCQSFASEQIDALCLAIKSFEKNNAFILGDMAGIGKGRVCAGVLRYAYVNGMIPVFFTQKPYLLNDIYRDLRNIGGIGEGVMPRPFVMHNEGVIVDKDGLPIPTSQVYKTTYRQGEALYRFLDRGNPYSIIELCKSMTEEIKRTGNVMLPKEFNAVMLPYSVISQSKSVDRKEFLNAIAPNSILVFDESHNAASANLNSNILRTGLPLVEASKAVLFSSATYAKRPSVFNLYVVKTALRTAVPSLESITDALKVGGENVSEYIASGLVKEGQMIRRERSFGDCKKITDYVGTLRREDSFGNTTYADLPDDTQRAFYDEAIGYFKELRDFSKSDLSKTAIKNAIYKKAEELGKEIVSMDIYNEAVNAAKDVVGRVQREWISRNLGKYVVQYSTDNISYYKATFRENLFLAVKAKFAADKIIECLNTPVTYKNVDGSMHTAPQKPIIAIKNTGERIFGELKLTEGQEVQNDFSVYLKAVYNKLFQGTFTLRKVDNNIFKSESKLSEDDLEADVEEFEYLVTNDDFYDGGQQVNEIQSKLDAYNSQLPFSIIDYLRDRIESVQRPPIYFAPNGAPLFGRAGSQNYKFVEGTSRQFMLKRDSDGVLRYMRNDRIKSTTKVFRAFNDGDIDVMLINVVASTGGSAQSSPEEGIDTRPRNMFIVQFELDINIEVQKRGRINRTGQINSPTYTYIISKIPVELRTYLMFRKKLRKLDANTSADQTASSKTSEITDAKGNAIEDIFNHYGFEVFKKDFIDLPDNLAYYEIFNNMDFRSKAVSQEEEAEVDEINIERFDSFVKELELYPSKFQEYFFDEMNEKYIQEKNRLIAQGEYQAELEAQNYKASLKQRVVTQLNSGSTVFSLPLFIADYYTLESKRAWSKDRVDQKAAELSVWNGQPLQPNEFYANFIEDYIRESSKSVNTLRQELDALEGPKKEEYENEDKFDRAMFLFEARKNARETVLKDKIKAMKEMLGFYKPFTPVMYDGNVGYFVGYKIKDTGTKFKYTEGSIEFIFCFLSKYPTIHLKMSSNSEELAGIKLVTQTMLSEENIRRVRAWKPDLNKRQVRRFLSGNILSGIIEASKKKKVGDIKNWALSRFTNIDGSISTAIELKYDKDLPDNAFIRQSATNLSVAADNANIVDYISDMPVSFGDSFKTDSNNYVRSQTIYPIWNIEGDKICDRAIAIVRRDLRNNDIATVQGDQVYNSAGEPIRRYNSVVQFEIMQSYKIETLKESRQKVEKARKEGEVLYNKLYYDQEFQDRFSANLITATPQKKTIEYAFLRLKKKDSNYYTSKYNDFNTYIKRYEYNLETDGEKIMEFLTVLYNKYDVSFNFRSDVAEYFNIDAQADTFDPTKKEQKALSFPEGEYQYRFIRKVPESVYESIPNLIRKTFDGAYGGVILAQPIIPNMLPSFELKPFNIPSDILVKLTLSVLNDEDKTQFAKALEQMAETKDAYDIGEFVRTFISQRSVGTQYFFGDLRVADYGRIFKDFALKEDVSSLVFSSEDVVIEQKPVQTEVTFDDAERFIIKLWSLI